MHYAAIKTHDIANGPGVRVSLFVSGCTHHCRACFNPETWDFRYGQIWTPDAEQQVLDALAPSWIRGLSLLGGEPFEPQNQPAVLALCRRVRAELPEKTIWCYSGYTLEQDLLPPGRACCESTAPLLALLDILVDGEFVAAEKDLTLRFRGSRNQRIIDMPQSLRTGSIVLWQG